jgi:hypothetical protein
MRSACLLTLACTVASLSIASTKTPRIPAAVHKSFSHQYHHATFKADRWRQVAYYTPDGAWLKTATQIPWSRNLPVCVKRSLTCSRFAFWKIDGITMVESPDNKYYTVAVYQDTAPEGAIPGDWVDKYVLYFSSEGILVRIVHLQ